MFTLTQLSKMQLNYKPYNSLEEAYNSDTTHNLNLKSYSIKDLDDYAKYTNIRNKIGKLEFTSRLEFDMNDLAYSNLRDELSNLRNDSSILKLSGIDKMRRTLEYKASRSRIYKKKLLNKYIKNNLIERSKDNERHTILYRDSRNTFY